MPNASTTATSIPGSGVTLDLNGFLIRGTSTFLGPPATICTNPGSGLGIGATGNAVDGLFGGQRSLVRGNVTIGSLDDGIALLDGGQALASTTSANGNRGITVLGSTGAGNATAVGLNVSNGNGDLELSGGVLVGCNVLDLVPSCPP